MKTTLRIIILVVTVSAGTLHAQDAPLFTQKLTNSFLYNPSVAGNTFGSITLSHRKFWSAVEGSPTTNFFSAHTPFGQHRFGTGINFYQDQVGITQAIYGSAAFAYHIKITDAKMLSFGVSGEFNSLKLDRNRIDVVHENDPLLTGGSRNGFDFNFGMSLKTDYFKIGAAANRITNITSIVDSTDQFPGFYSGYLQFMLPLAGGRDVLEPIVMIRNYAQGGTVQIDGGLYYTVNDMLTLGGSYRTGGAINASAAFRWKNVMLGYSRDIITGDVRQALGATNEFTLRFDFFDESYYLKARNARAINTKAMTIRRKTISTYNHRGSQYQHSQRYKKQLRRKSFMSPNYRISASKKLMNTKGKRKPAHRKTHKPRR